MNYIIKIKTYHNIQHSFSARRLNADTVSFYIPRIVALFFCHGVHAQRERLWYIDSTWDF